MNIRDTLSQLDRLFGNGSREDIDEFLNRSIRSAADEEDDAALLTLYNEKSGFLRNTGRADQAFDLADDALNLIYKLGLENTVQHALTLINGATAGRMACLNGQALGLYAQAENILKALKQEESYGMAALYNNMSQVYQQMAVPAMALEYQEKALAIIDALPEARAEAAITRENIALSLMSLQRPDEAKARLDEAMAYFESPEGQNDSHLGSMYSSMAEYCFQCGDRAGAVSYYEKALAAVRRFYGDNHASRIIEANLGKLRAE